MQNTNVFESGGGHHAVHSGALRITLIPTANLSVMRLDGPLVLGLEREAMTSARSHLSNHPVQGVAIDFDGLARLDSAGLGELVRMVAVMEQIGTRIAFANPSSAIKELLQLTRVCSLAPVFDNLGAALDHLARP